MSAARWWPPDGTRWVRILERSRPGLLTNQQRGVNHPGLGLGPPPQMGRDGAVTALSRPIVPDNLAVRRSWPRGAWREDAEADIGRRGRCRIFHRDARSLRS